uniref:Candidate secreted effector n=1 Tax=Meloidogyne incognita TaxID=6306 RepID=A0A914MG78_MELIC
MPRPRPQPFPFIASRRRASTASHNALPSSYSFNFGSNLPGNRHSLPRLSITSLGSVAKTFRYSKSNGHSKLRSEFSI